MVVGQMVGSEEGKKAKEEKAKVGDGSKTGDKKK
jgi:hypothetical protein